ncbi:HEAT repeat domain-containing protein [Chloroflexi bacterium TSY]|nr:HEAT repeat domain-containing protein [Chloroflexi bacterium TSY]
MPKNENSPKENQKNKFANSSQSDTTVESLLYGLIGDAEDAEISQLLILSDLSRQNAHLVHQHWNSIPQDRRRSVIQILVNEAEVNLDVHLERLLRITLEDADPTVRALSIRGLCEEQSSDLVGRFIHMLQDDPDQDVRIEAAKALGNYVLAGELNEFDASLAMHAEEELLSMIHSLNEPLELRCASLESVAYSGELGIRQMIEDAYYDSEEEMMRLSALVAMGRSADVRWRGFVRAELQNPSPSMRTQAAISAGELETQTALDDLLRLVDDPEKSVRLAAIFALGRIGGQDATDALETVSQTSEPDEIKAAQDALEEMAFYANPEGTPLFDETEEDLIDLEIDSWNTQYDWDDLDWGEYEE